MWRLMMLTPCTTTRFLSGITAVTVPRLDRSFPAITTTRSSRRIRAISEHLRGERYDPHEVSVAQLARHGTEDTRSSRYILLVDDDRRVLIEADVRAVGPTVLLGGTDDDGPNDLALLHRSTRRCLLDRCHDDVADSSNLF